MGKQDLFKRDKASGIGRFVEKCLFQKKIS